MRLLVINYAGDVRETIHRFSSGGQETYYAQKYSIESYLGLRQYADEVAILTCLTQEAYNEVLPNGIRVIGCGFHQGVDIAQLIRLIEIYDPTHLVLGMIDRDLIKWSVKHKIPTITAFANAISAGSPSFLKSLIRHVRNRSIAKFLNSKNIEWVGSYGINSSRDLQSLGVNPDKIIPWDYLLDTTAGSFLPKSFPSAERPFTLVYVGTISAAKGVGDLLEAIAKLKAKSFLVRLKLVGSDYSNFASNLMAKLGIEDCVEMLGIVPSQAIEPLMNSADLVVVPSRHEYPEGFPLVIHHALRACTPIVASDHRMFAKRLRHGVNAMIYPSGNASMMSDCIEEILTNTTLYEKISSVSHATWYELRLPVKWADLVHRWARQSQSDQQWLANHSLSNIFKAFFGSMRYDDSESLAL